MEPLPPEQLRAIADEIRMRGLCVVDNVIPTESLVRSMRATLLSLRASLPPVDPPRSPRVLNRTQDRLAPMMLGQAAQLEAREAWRLRGERPRHGTRGPGIHGGQHKHLQQAPPRHAPWVTSGWVANPIIEQIAIAVLGEGCYLSYCDGNTSLPGSGYQSLHIDSPSPWPTKNAAAAVAEAFPARTTHLIVNFSPIAVDESRGAIEVWPGTHLATEADANGLCNPQTRDDALFMLEDFPEFVRKFKPARMATKLGAVCFRDARCWHRGVPNVSQTPRPMVALIYNTAKLRASGDPHLGLAKNLPSAVATHNEGSSNADALVFGNDCKVEFAVPNPFGMDRNVRFTDDAIDHLGRVAAGLPPPLRGPPQQIKQKL